MNEDNDFREKKMDDYNEGIKDRMEEKKNFFFLRTLAKHVTVGNCVNVKDTGRVSRSFVRTIRLQLINSIWVYLLLKLHNGKIFNEPKLYS